MTDQVRQGRDRAGVGRARRHGPQDGGGRPGRGHLGQCLGTGRRTRPGHPERSALRPAHPGTPSPSTSTAARSSATSPPPASCRCTSRSTATPTPAPSSTPTPYTPPPSPPSSPSSRSSTTWPRALGGPVRVAAYALYGTRRAGREHAPRPARPHRLPPAEPRHGHLRRHPRPGLRPHRPAGVDVPALAGRRARCPATRPTLLSGAQLREAAEKLQGLRPARLTPDAPTAGSPTRRSPTPRPSTGRAARGADTGTVRPATATAVAVTTLLGVGAAAIAAGRLRQRRRAQGAAGRPLPGDPRLTVHATAAGRSP